MTIDRNRIFLIDGVGAIVTATLLASVLAQLEGMFGIPRRAVYFLAAIAVCFAIYSLALYFSGPESWPPFLRAIPIANLGYCVLTLILLYVFRSEITALGIAYFAAEILVVTALACYELMTVRRGIDR